MNKKLALSVLSVLAVFISVTFTSFVSADTAVKDSLLMAFEWGDYFDYPTANWYVHQVELGVAFNELSLK
jgi:hypothetical protein